MQRFRRIPFHGEVGRQPVGHLAVGLGGGQRLLQHELGSALAVAQLHVAHRDGRKDDAQRGVIVDHLLQRRDGLGQLAHAHLLIALRDPQQRLPRLQRQPLFDLVGGQLQLVLILIDPRAMVVDHRRVRRVLPQRDVELLQRLFVQPVDAQR